MMALRLLTTPRSAAVAGMVGPVLFAGVLLALTAAEYDFMLGIGWRPLEDPAGAWPSGLALGPYGWAQVVNFVVSGLLLAIFALGLWRRTSGGHRSRAGPALLLLAGVAMALMGFETDPIHRTGPRTLHGLIHDAAFVLFVFSLVPALFLLWASFRGNPLWRGHARYTLVTATLAALALLLPGVAYYLFVAVVLAWIGATGRKLWRSLGS